MTVVTLDIMRDAALVLALHSVRDATGVGFAWEAQPCDLVNVKTIAEAMA